VKIVRSIFLFYVVNVIERMLGVFHQFTVVNVFLVISLAGQSAVWDS